MIDYSLFHPTKAERRFLNQLKRKEHLPLPKGMERLIEFDIVANDVKAPNGYEILAGTVHISTGYKHWASYNSDYFFVSKLPVWISITALVFSAVAIALTLILHWTELMQLLK